MLSYKVLSMYLCLTGFVLSTESGNVGERLGRKSLQDALLSYMCRSRNGLICNNQGDCNSGKCVCFRGSGPKCENPVADDVTQETRPRFDRADSPPSENSPGIMACFGNSDGVCNGHGSCVNGMCLCEPNWSGVTCELLNSKGFCETYRSCAECTSLMEACPASCTVGMNYQLVYGFKTSGGSFHRCRYRNSAQGCSFHFQLGGISSSGVKTILVKPCMKYGPSTAPTKSVTPVTPEEPVSQEVTSDPNISVTTIHNESVSDDKSDKDFCEKYGECAECTALSTQCPEKCGAMANFNLVFDFPISGQSFHRCRSRNSQHKCSFYFQLDSRSTGTLKNIMVKTCMKYRTTQLPVTQRDTTEVTSPEDGETTDDTNQQNRSDRKKGSKDGENAAIGLNAAENVYLITAINVITFLWTYSRMDS